MKKIKERAILVGLREDLGRVSDTLSTDPLEELKLLAETAGAEIVGSLTQPRSRVQPRFFIGQGKAQELKEIVNTLEATTVIFDNELTPAQVSNHEKLLGVKVIDRPGLILDIFALHARTREAKTQVELAQLKYLLPRLTRQWTHLSRQVGGIGVRGPGETQLEVDRRRVRERIARLTLNLKKIEKQGITKRKTRTKSFTITLVGYTNAGKSTLFNVLSRADAPVEDMLFKTLDSKTREIKFDYTPTILLSDTVGFIRNLPHELIASFQSTLADVREADLLLHVIDITNPAWKEQMDVAENVLNEIGASSIETINVFNKIDCLEIPSVSDAMQSRYPSAVFVSAKTNAGIDELKNRIKTASLRGKLLLTMDFGRKNSELLREVYRYGTIIDTRGDEDSITLTFALPVSVAKKLGLAENHSSASIDTS